MKCPKCKHDAVEIRGKYFCPSCGEKIDLDYVKHELEEEMEEAKKRAKAFKNPAVPKSETDDVKVGLAAPPEEKPKSNPILDYFEEDKPKKEEENKERQASAKTKVPPQDYFNDSVSDKPTPDNIEQQNVLSEEPGGLEESKDSESSENPKEPGVSEPPPVFQGSAPETEFPKPLLDNKQEQKTQAFDVPNKSPQAPSADGFNAKVAPKHVNDVMPPQQKAFGDNPVVSQTTPAQNLDTKKQESTPRVHKNAGMSLKLKMLLAAVVVLNILIILGIIYLLVLKND